MVGGCEDEQTSAMKDCEYLRFLTSLDWDTAHGSIMVTLCEFGIRNEGYINASNCKCRDT